MANALPNKVSQFSGEVLRIEHSSLQHQMYRSSGGLPNEIPKHHLWSATQQINNSVEEVLGETMIPLKQQ
ncbi:7910_t:CDS:2 [Acaulospora colombiana]|uniref:7910_t:CDS:1 n=1 Tax=Acaulospora colombiana TaxID=27376 RepID=A0ACA9KEX0_9GLOM|nr:7910_t:CDS:2 [Acaulospora colombiana]